MLLCILIQFFRIKYNKRETTSFSFTTRFLLFRFLPLQFALSFMCVMNGVFFRGAWNALFDGAEHDKFTDDERHSHLPASYD